MHTLDHSPLGKTAAYRGRYAPELLYPIPRAPKRADAGLPVALAMHGVDIWNAYELSWLNARGKPQVAMDEFRVPAESPQIIESKSFKLYLNGFAGERMDPQTLQTRLQSDLSAAAGAPVRVRLIAAAEFAAQALHAPQGACIDGLDLAIDHYGPPRPECLQTDPQRPVIEETLTSQLLKSNCPVTGQPDWGSVQIAYRGAPIDHAGLLRYVISFREHNDFHEQCVERIFADIVRRCAPQELSVQARYTRRGGLDINPFRTSRADLTPANLRDARQ